MKTTHLFALTTFFFIAGCNQDAKDQTAAETPADKPATAGPNIVDDSITALAEPQPQITEKGCAAASGNYKMRALIPAGSDATHVRVVSHLGCSVTVPDGTKVATIYFMDANGNRSSDMDIAAGRDTSEWAYDRADLSKTIAHTRASIVDSFEADGFDGHWYGAKIALPPPAQSWTVVELETGALSPAPINFRDLELIKADGGTIPLSFEPVISKP